MYDFFFTSWKYDGLQENQKKHISNTQLDLSYWYSHLNIFHQLWTENVYLPMYYIAQCIMRNNNNNNPTWAS